MTLGMVPHLSALLSDNVVIVPRKPADGHVIDHVHKGNPNANTGTHSAEPEAFLRFEVRLNIQPIGYVFRRIVDDKDHRLRDYAREAKDVRVVW